MLMFGTTRLTRPRAVRKCIKRPHGKVLVYLASLSDFVTGRAFRRVQGQAPAELVHNGVSADAASSYGRLVDMQAPAMRQCVVLPAKLPSAAVPRVHPPATQSRVQSLRTVSQRHLTTTSVAALEDPATETAAASSSEPLQFEEVGLRRVGSSSSGSLANLRSAMQHDFRSRLALRTGSPSASWPLSQTGIGSTANSQRYCVDPRSACSEV